MKDIVYKLKCYQPKMVLEHLFYKAKAKYNKRKIINSIDKDDFKLIFDKYKDTDPAPGYSKYLDLEKWIEVNLIIFYRAGLDKENSLTILDIGTGCGYFPYICQYYGHKVKSLDVPTVDMYNELTCLLNIDREEWTINAYEKLPDFGLTFDYATAFMICFNAHKTSNVWSVSEWKYFLNDLIDNHVSEKGKLYFQLNPEEDGTYYDQKLYKYFIESGASIQNEVVKFNTVEGLRGG